MRRSVHWTLILGALLALTFGVAACGGDDGDGGEQDTTTGTPSRGQEGRQADRPLGRRRRLHRPGHHVLPAGPARSPTPRRARSTPPRSTTLRWPSRVLAEADPEISEDGCTVTVTIKDRREVLAAGRPRGHLGGRQVRHRARLLQQRQQRLRGRVLRRPQGRQGRCQAGHRRSPASRRRTTRPSSSTSSRARADKCAGGILARALVMPLSAPVPKEYAEKFDAKARRRPTARTRSPPART